MLILYAISLFFVSNVCIAQELKLFERDSQTDGYDCHATDSRLLATHESYIHCAAHCQATNRCKRMFYDVVTKQCAGCSTIRYQLSGSAGSLSYIAVSTTTDISYLGCFPDRQLPNRVLPYENMGSPSMTNEKCFQHCIVDNGYRYMATQYGNQCFCGISYEASRLLPDRYCSMACGGNSTQSCGGSWKNSIYSY